MALSADTVVEVRTGGSDNNGGAFVSGGAGSDYSQQDAAAYNGTDLTVDGSDNTKVVPDGHTPAAADVDNHIQITAGAGFTPGFYRIVSQDGSAWTLDRSPAATSTSGGTWYMGGALASPGMLGKFISDHGVSGGMKAWIASGTYTLSSSSANVAGGTIDLPNTDFWIEGYGSSRGDLGTPPVFDAGAQTSITLVEMGGDGFTQTGISNLIADGNSGSGNAGFSGGYTYGGAVVYRCKVRDCATGFNGVHNQFCVAEDCTLGFAFVTGYLLCANAWAKGGTTGFSSANSGAMLVSPLATGQSGKGIDLTNAYGARVIRPTVYGTGSDGIYTNRQSAIIVDGLVVGCGGYGFNVAAWMNLLNCAGYNNTSGNRDVQSLYFDDVIALTGDPFVDAASDDFRLNNTAGAGAACRAAGLGHWGQTNHHDIGAVQHEDAGGGGGGSVSILGG